MEDFEKKMVKIFLDHPFDYPEYIAHYKNKGYAFRIIKNLIPTDTGIEFEVGSTLCTRALRKRQVGGWPKLMHENSDEVTFRISFSSRQKDIEQLGRLFKFWNKPDNNKARSPYCGIHIHTNILSNRKNRLFNRNFTKSSFSDLISNYQKDLDECVKLTALNYFEYKGKYNALDFWNCKSHSIIHRDELNTFEYRCIEMTWDLRTLLKHIILCHHWTQNVILLSQKKINIQEFKDRTKSLINFMKEI